MARKKKFHPILKQIIDEKANKQKQTLKITRRIVQSCADVQAINVFFSGIYLNINIKEIMVSIEAPSTNFPYT